MQESEASVSVKALQTATQDYYRKYNARKGVNRNSLLHNPEVLFQCLAQDTAMIRALRSIHADPQTARVLDIGCGDGAGLWLLLRLGFDPANLFGVDIQQDSIHKAQATNPLVSFECGDAACLSFRDNTFDVSLESMMFLQLTDDDLAGRIASEMIRVTKPGGALLVSDWRYSKPGSHEFKGVSASRISDLYQVGTRTEVCCTFRGSLIPPLGRFLSKYFSPCYFVIQGLFPVLVGHQLTVLRKLKNG